jgi:hypothetical protein
MPRGRPPQRKSGASSAIFGGGFPCRVSGGHTSDYIDILALWYKFVGLVVGRWMAAMRVGSVEMQPKMAEGAALFRPTILALESIWMKNNTEPRLMGRTSLTHPKRGRIITW